MKRLTILILLVWLISSAKAQTSDTLYNCYFRQADFATVCQVITSKTGKLIYYKPLDVERLRLSLETDKIAAIDLLRQALDGSGLTVSPWQNSFVVMKGQNLPTALPDFEKLQSIAKTNGGSKQSLTQSEERYLTGRKTDAVQSVTIGKPGGQGSGGKCTIQAHMIDAETGEPIIGATMFIQETKTGGVANNSGFLSVVLKSGSYTALFECIGYEKKKYLMTVYSDGNFEVALQQAVYEMKGVVVYGDRLTSMKTKDPGMDKINVKSIKEIPMMMGERDILKVSGMLPGIVSVGEGAAGLNIRGGSSDQNAFYINKIPIYNTSHVFGFFPAFNSDIIKDVTIYKGHVPVEYGGRLSSVFDLVARQGNSRKFALRGGISPVAANIVAEGPILKNSLSVILGARSTYSDYVLKRIKDPDVSASTANFNDISAGVNYNRQKLQIGAFGYHSTDNFKYSSMSDYFYKTNGASLTGGYNFNTSLRGELSLVASQYDFSTNDRLEKTTAYSHGYSIGHYEVRIDFKHVINDKNSFVYGIGSILYQLNRGMVEPYNQSSLRLPVDLGKEKGIENAIYFSDEFTLNKKIRLNAGFRYTLFAPLGQKTVYTYVDGAPREPLYIADTLHFSENEPIRWYHEPDFRISLVYETDENGSVKLAFNQMHQNLFMLNNAIAIAPNTQWKLSDYYLTPSRSQQLSLGIFRNNKELGFEASAEVYYKKTDHFPEFKDGADFLQNPLTEAMVLQGNDNAYGFEFLLKRNSRRVEGWISYTYSRTLLQTNSDKDWYKINYGETYPAGFDIPHIVNLVANMHLSRRATFSTVATYQTGKPITYPTSVYYINGVPTINYSKRNEYRIPDYFRLDASLTIEGSLVRHKLIHSSFIVSCYNVLGRENAYSVYFQSVGGKIKSYQYSVIGVPVLTFTWLFKLGNYATE